MSALAPQEHALVTTARGIMAQKAGAAEVARALEVAKNSRGIVLQTDTDATENADASRVISDGLKALKAAKDAVLEIPKAMVAAVNAVAKPLELALTAGKQARADAALAYRAQQEAALRAAQAERQREIYRLAAEARAAQAAAAPFEDPEEEIVPLAAPSGPVKAPTMVRGGASSQVFSEILTCELVNHHECDPAWLTLRTADALSYAREQIRRGDMAKPGDVLHPVEEKGCRFFYRTSVGDRAR